MQMYELAIFMISSWSFIYITHESHQVEGGHELSLFGRLSTGI